METDVFIPGPAPATPTALERQLERGETDLALHVPRGFTRDVLQGRPGGLGINVDGTNSSLAGRAAGDVQAALMQETRRQLGAPPPAQIAAVTRFLYNPELESRHYMVPGVLVMLVTIIAAFITGMAVVREKEIGTLEQLLVSPLRPSQIVLGKTIPFVVVAYFELFFAGTVAMLWFRLPLEGSILLLAVAAMAYLLVTLGVGLLASTVSQTQQQAMFTVWFFLVFGFLMSGFFYPVDNMPVWAQWISAADPVRYIMDIVRGIFLKGAGWSDLWIELTVLTGMGVLAFGSAVQRFQKRLS
jgi:ABC-2 type transport system permease protein